MEHSDAPGHFKYNDTHTTISRLYVTDGLLHLKTQRLDGVPLHEFKQPQLPLAIEKDEGIMNSTILPQLRSLRRKL